MWYGRRMNTAFPSSATALQGVDVPKPLVRPKRIAVLGSTGSIGRNTLDLVAGAPGDFEVTALVAGNNVGLLIEQALKFRPKLAVLADPSGFATLKQALAGSGIEAASGRQAVIDAASMPQDLVVAAIVGAAGLEPTLAAIKRGTAVALANKESLVTAGELVVREAERHSARILPVDSEHNAVFQAFENRNAAQVETVTLTASGGPFRTWDRARIAAATPEQALRHPNWSMGPKVTIDSATLMNKGLELIEAFHLFPVEEHQLRVVIHPQSIVHGMVGYSDGSVLAQMGTPDMRTPISYCLGWPERMPWPSAPLDLAAAGTLSFEAPDLERFPALALARDALRRMGGAPCVLNAANEIAVERFLAGEAAFMQIPAIVSATLESAERRGMLAEPGTLDAALELDRWARETAGAAIRESAAKAY